MLPWTDECDKIEVFFLYPIDYMKFSITPNKNLKKPCGSSVRAYAARVSSILYSTKYSWLSLKVPNVDSSNSEPGSTRVLTSYFSSSFSILSMFNKLDDMAGTRVSSP